MTARAGRPFRFGVSMRAAGSRAEWQAKARTVEELGFNVLLVPDHLAAVFPPLTALCTAAEATTRLRFGTFVLNNDFRHPVLVAREVAAIDLLTDGRFELGIGAGHAAEEYEGIGLRYSDGRARAARLAEAVGIIRPLLAGEVVEHTGVHYQVAAQRVFPTPRQARVPVLVGGNSRAVLRLAAEEADIVGFTGFFTQSGGGGAARLAHFTAAGLDDRLDIVRAAAGERFTALELNVLVQTVVRTDDVVAASTERAGQMPGLSAQQLLESPFLLFGTPRGMADALIARRARFGVSYIVVFERDMETLAPVVALLRGR